MTKKALIPIETAWNNQAKFIQDASHELRTPINIFYSTIQLLDISLVKTDKDFRKIYEKYKKQE